MLFSFLDVGFLCINFVGETAKKLSLKTVDNIQTKMFSLQRFFFFILFFFFLTDSQNIFK